jgi:hypothetical protein
MIGVALIPKGAHGKFLDRPAIMAKMDKAIVEGLMHCGGAVKKTAQNSMRYNKQGLASAPGKPPNAHSNPLLREKIEFIYNGVNSAGVHTVVVGPVKLSGRRGTLVPKLHEEGGTQKSTLMPNLRVGDYGPISMDLSKKSYVMMSRKIQNIFNRTGNSNKSSQIKAKLNAMVIAELTTQKMVDKANFLYAFAVAGGGALNPMATYPARPYMQPALKINQPRFAGFFKNTFK